jgi:hypothetical protein
MQIRFARRRRETKFSPSASWSRGYLGVKTVRSDLRAEIPTRLFGDYSDYSLKRKRG